MPAATKHHQDISVLSEFLDSLSDHDASRFLALWNDDAVWEFPFGTGVRRLEGKSEIEAFITRFFETFTRVAFEDVQTYPAVETDLVFSEYRGDMEVGATGRPYRNTYIAKVRLSGGKIASVREYFNPTVVADAMAPQ